MKRHRIRSYRPRVFWCEERVLPAALSNDVLAGIAQPLALGTTQSGTLAPDEVSFFEIDDLNSAGILDVMLHTEETHARLTLLDGTNHVLMQSEGQSTTNPDAEIQLDVPAGTDFLEVQNLGGAGDYILTCTWSPPDSPYQPISLGEEYEPVSPLIVAGNFLGDGHTDLAMSSTGGSGVEILNGNGDGTFGFEESFYLPYIDFNDHGNPVIAMTAGDFTGNDRSDLAVVLSGTPNTVLILVSSGSLWSTQWTLDGSYAVGSGAASIVPGDFRGDGRVDLAVANEEDNDVSILLNNGDGSFQMGETVPVGSAPDALVAADFNGDGRTDLAVANANDDDVSIFLSNGDGTFLNRVSYLVGPDPTMLATGDFRGDGRIDLAVAEPGDPNVSILLGNGDGTFQNPVSVAVGVSPDAFATADFRGDGRTDLAVANATSNNLTILLSNGDGTFQSPRVFALGYIPYTGPSIPPSLPPEEPSVLRPGAVANTSVNLSAAIVAGDFTGDGRTDLAVVNGDSAVLSILLGNGDGDFQAENANTVGFVPEDIITGDFNGDGRLDLAVVNSGDDDVSILLGNGDGTFQKQTTYAVGAGPVAIVTGDFNGDGRLDLAVVNSGDDDVSILLGNGDGTFQKQTTYAVGAGPDAIAAGDFNGDGHLDLAVVNSGDDDVSILLGNGDGTFQPQKTYAVGAKPDGIVAGDFNGDGHLDLAVANFNDNDVSVLLGNGDGTFHEQKTYAVGVGPVGIVASDFNGDGRLDLAVVDNTSGSVSILLGNGDGTFQNLIPYGYPVGYPYGYPVGYDPVAVVTGDFNGDGHTDLAVYFAVVEQYGIYPGVALLLGNGDGTFDRQYVDYPLDVTIPTSLSNTTTLAAGDFNGDGRTDLAAVDQTTNNVSILLGTSQGLASPGQIVTTPQTNPVVADLRGSGVDDVFTIDATGDILWRRAAGQVGVYDPPIVINPSDPSRDITSVGTTDGSLLASVDTYDDAVSLFAWRNGAFALVGKLNTGSLPTQVVAGDLDGDGTQDLVVLNEGDETVSIFLGAPPPADDADAAADRPFFTFQGSLYVGPSISQVSLAALDSSGNEDILVANKSSGLVGVLKNLGGGFFAPPLWYRAGGGLYAATQDSSGALTVTTLEATTAVVAGAFNPGSLPDLVALNPGSNSVGVLENLGDGLIANPTTLLTPSPATAAQVADLNGDGVPDLALLSNAGVSLAFADGGGGFLPLVTYAAGPAPTGLTIASLNGHPDLLVSDAQGDILVLLGDGKGDFQQPQEIDQSVALATAERSKSGGPAFFLASQPNDSVSVQFADGSATLLNRSDGLLDPGAVKVADLNNDGVPYLIVANSGGNDVLVYPILAGDELGTPLNNGFATGTDPVGITLANLNGRPDLIVADKGSNDVTILLNQALSSGGFTFVEGPRLKVGLGPVATVVQDVNGDGIPDLIVSNSGSNSVSVLPGVGGGFFNDTNETTIPVGMNPGPLFVIPNAAQPGQIEVVTVNAGSDNLSVLVDRGAGNFDTQATLPSGGTEPLTAVEGTFGGEDGLLVGNTADGELALFLDGPGGLELAKTFEDPNVPNPSGLAIDSAGAVYANTDGVAAAFPIILGLGTSPTAGGSSAATVVLSSGPTEEQVVLLQPLSQTSLALIATLFSVSGEMTTEEEAVPTATALPNQPICRSDVAPAGESTDVAPQAAPLPGQSVPPAVTRFVTALNDAFAKARLKVRDGSLFARATRTAGDPPSLQALDTLIAQWSPIVATFGGPKLAIALNMGRGILAAARVVDTAVESMNDDRDGVDPSPRLEPGEVQTPSEPASQPVGALTIGLAALARSIHDFPRPERRPLRHQSRPHQRNGAQPDRV